MNNNILETTLISIISGILFCAITGGVVGFTRSALSTSRCTYFENRFDELANDTYKGIVYGASYGVTWPITLPCALVAKYQTK